MKIHGLGSSIMQSASELNDIWSHLPEEERVEQIEAHLESEGFTNSEIYMALEDLGYRSFNEFEIVSVGCC
jgi:DNA polymerase III sliding clamp (beta) subunit (PCNA family)